jgi:DNA-binding protein H-NS
MDLSLLDEMSLEELVNLKNKANQLIYIKQEEQKLKLLEEFKQRASRMGLSFDEVVVGSGYSARKSKGSKVPPKYRHPNDPEMTWTGRGRTPLWIVDLIDSGFSLNDLLIETEYVGYNASQQE